MSDKCSIDFPNSTLMYGNFDGIFLGQWILLKFWLMAANASCWRWD